MKYGEELNKGLHRLILDEIDSALQVITASENTEEKHEAVHEVRKSFKKIRGAFRMVRPKIDFYKSENRFFRDEARKISELRDTTANIETLDELKEQYSSKLYNNSFEVLRNKLIRRREDFALHFFDDEDILESIRESVTAHRKEVETLDIPGQKFKDLRPGIRKVYKRGRKGYLKCKEKGTVEQIHDWRKRNKYLRYQIDALNQLWPAMMSTLEDELHEITDLTGKLHDIEELKEVVNKLDDPFSDEKEELLFYSLAEQMQNHLREHSLIKAEKFYRQKPDEFCDRLEHYWKSYEKEIENDIPKKDNLIY
ncbi:MAG: CHAD domain-containing protein [Saprospiraceae bacterium]|nr:CHAD domain-containing protein [Saprospiraceae bacterium]